LRPGRHNQRIEFEARTVSQRHLPCDGVKINNFAQQHANVLPMAQDTTEGRGNFTWRERSRRHLIHKGLKEVIVAAIYEGDGDRRRFEGFRGIKAAKTTTKDNDVVCAGHKSVSPHLLCRACRMPNFIHFDKYNESLASHSAAEGCVWVSAKL